MPPTVSPAAGPPQTTPSTLMAHLGPVEVATQEWRVPRKVVALKVAATVALAAAAWWVSADTVRLIVACAATLIAAIFAARDLLVPVRLTVDIEGIGVADGFAPLRHVDWKDIVRIRVDSHQRFGITSSLLEIDVDSTLFLFSRNQIDADPEEAAEALRAWKRRASGIG